MIAGQFDEHQASVEAIQASLQAQLPLRLRVCGASMEPILKDGDYIYLEAFRSDTCRLGDLLTFINSGELLTHRVIAKINNAYLMKGDNSVHSEGPIQQELILGRVSAFERPGGRYDLDENNWTRLNYLLADIGRAEWKFNQMTRYNHLIKRYSCLDRMLVRIRRITYTSLVSALIFLLKVRC